MKTALEMIRPEAEALNPDELKTPTVDFELAKGNAARAVAAVERGEAEIKAYAKHYISAAVRLWVLFDAFQAVTRLVDLARPLALGVRKLLDPVYADRDVLMAQLTVWGKVNLVPANEVERIKAGTGPIDAAQDVLSIIELPSRYPVLEGKLLHSAKELDQMVQRAKALLAVVKPTSLRRTNDGYAEQLDLQARVWTLLVRQYERLWKDGAFLYGREVDEYVPALGSRVVVKHRADPVVPGPTPEPQ